ncbi:hypothetical protein [Mucilaginibacter gilvus]|uniref:Outer membrane protein beta-barrel domain-containing protein n=1 Tax=Mucilaginibacter gilvus TaxID=2305909 RepID=A0A444MN22_9SPHI|nr:hypothetical protein [Mucilaginibacter gilvus]RWY51104.1 hypothetical protein EPL05_13635 [Mucilaginibacter gilvus]
MDEQFDEKLKSRITEVFDNYEFPPADEAWLELRKKLLVKEERKVAWLWWSSAAAILLLFLGVGLWLNYKPDAVTNVAANHSKPLSHVAEEVDSVKQTEAAPNNIASAQPQPVNSDSRSIAPAASNKYTAGNNKPLREQHAPLGNAGTLPVAMDGTQKAGIAKQDQSVTAIAGNLPVSKQAPVNATTLPDVKKPVTAKTDQQQVAKIDAPVNVADNSQTNAVASTKTNSVIAQQPAKTIDDLFKETQPSVVARQKAGNKELKKVNFSVYAATYVNYAEGSANQVNAGAGFTSDIRLGKKIKLSTGVSLAQNTFSYAGLPPVSVTNRALAADALPAATKSDGFFSTVSSVAELKGSNASLVGLDIPINIKYEFNPDKTDTYISAGLSSGTFIDERYTYRYAYHNNSLGNSTVTTQDQTSTQSFNSFYFGKTLNVSFGTGFPIGKTNRLVIEPFLKYPLGGLGTQSIHFGSGGVNLKFNFKTTKK